MSEKGSRGAGERVTRRTGGLASALELPFSSIGARHHGDWAEELLLYGIGTAQLGNRHLIERSRFGDIALVVFLIAQASDGVLTYIGVRTFGMTAEGNPIVSWLMLAMGNGAGVATAKVAAGLFGIALHLSDVHKAVAALAGFYFLVAVGPWLALLFVLT